MIEGWRRGSVGFGQNSLGKRSRVTVRFNLDIRSLHDIEELARQFQP